MYKHTEKLKVMQTNMDTNTRVERKPGHHYLYQFENWKCKQNQCTDVTSAHENKVQMAREWFMVLSTLNIRNEFSHFRRLSTLGLVQFGFFGECFWFLSNWKWFCLRIQKKIWLGRTTNHAAFWQHKAVKILPNSIRNLQLGHCFILVSFQKQWLFKTYAGHFRQQIHFFVSLCFAPFNGTFIGTPFALCRCDCLHTKRIRTNRSFIRSRYTLHNPSLHSIVKLVKTLNLI